MKNNNKKCPKIGELIQGHENLFGQVLAVVLIECVEYLKVKVGENQIEYWFY